MRAGSCAALCALALCACATLTPALSEPWLGPGVSAGMGPRAIAGAPPALIAVGDVGVARRRLNPVYPAIARRLAGAPGVPIVVLGDVFYSDGLLGLCPERGRGVSRRSCEAPGPPERQLDGVLGYFAEHLPASPLLAIAGNHDHGGNPAATDNACRLVPRAGAGWAYLAKGCGLDPPTALRRFDLEGVTLFVLDSEMAIHDSDYRRSALAALHAELAAHRQEHPQVWRVLVMHHPLESYGRHNGAELPNALHKDLYLLLQSALAPLYWGALWLGPPRLSQDLYQWRYRAFRRDVYDLLADTPVDLVLSGHDHSEQLIEIDDPGVRWQIVSGSGAKQTRVARFGMDLLGANRLARLLGLSHFAPSVKHTLHFAAGRGARMPGRGFVALTPIGGELRAEFHSADSGTPVAVARLARR